jgi:hypothetical protein
LNLNQPVSIQETLSATVGELARTLAYQICLTHPMLTREVPLISPLLHRKPA